MGNRLKKYIKLLLSLCFFLFACEQRINSPSEEFSLNIILYDGLPDSVGDSVEQVINENVDRMTTDLQVEFNKPVTVKIWNNSYYFQLELMKITGQRVPGVTGYVVSENEFRLLNEGDLRKNALHEFAHLVTVNVNPKVANNPRWLWEAIAIYESMDYVDPKEVAYLREGKYPTLAELNSEVVPQLYMIYDVGYILAEFIITTWGKDKLIELIKKTGDISLVLGISTDAFQKLWYQDLDQRTSQ